MGDLDVVVGATVTAFVGAAVTTLVGALDVGAAVTAFVGALVVGANVVGALLVGCDVGAPAHVLPAHVNEDVGTQFVPLHTMPAAHGIPSGQLAGGVTMPQHWLGCVASL